MLSKKKQKENVIQRIPINLTVHGYKFLVKAIDCFLENKKLSEKSAENVEDFKKLLKENIKKFK